MEAIQQQQLSSSTEADGYSILMQEWSFLLKHHRYDVYLDLVLLKAALPDRDYINLAINMIFDAQQKINFSQQQFVMLVALSNFSNKTELVELIKHITPEQLPSEWHADLFFWQSFYSGELNAVAKVDKFLKSWQFTCEALAMLSPNVAQYDKAEILCEKALARQPQNAKAIAYLIYARTQCFPVKISLLEAAELIVNHNSLFGEHSLVATYLNSLIVKYVYLPEYLENNSSLHLIHSLGLDINEPFLKQAQHKFLHLVKGEVEGQAAHFFVRVRPSVMARIDEISENLTSDVSVLGEVIYSCFGESPPQRIITRIYKQYCVGDNQLINAKVVAEKIQHDYRAALFNYENHSSHPQSSPYELPQVDVSMLAQGRLISENKSSFLYGHSWQGQDVIIKSYKNIHLSESELLKMKDTIEIVSQLTNANSYLVKLLATHLSTNALMLVMENGGRYSLKNFLSSSTPKIPWSIRLKVAYQISCGLRYLHHKGVAYQYLSSANVILYAAYIPKLTNFGLVESSMQHSQAEESLDDVRYRAPESVGDVESINDVISDIWSFGMLCFELATRYQPFHDAATTDIAKQWIAQNVGEHISESCEVEQPKFARLMKSCWADRQQRPAIDEIAQSDCFINPY